jgi:hypothetical protein
VAVTAHARWLHIADIAHYFAAEIVRGCQPRNDLIGCALMPLMEHVG